MNKCSFGIHDYDFFGYQPKTNKQFRKCTRCKKISPNIENFQQVPVIVKDSISVTLLNEFLKTNTLLYGFVYVNYK